MAVETYATADSTYYSIVKTRYRDGGIVALPVYGNPMPNIPQYPNGQTNVNAPTTPTPCRIVRLSAPAELLTITFQAVKEGMPPFLPNPYLFDTNLVFRGGKQGFAVPVVLASNAQAHAWSISGTYEYYIQNPLDLNSTMNCGKMPFDIDLALEDSYMPNNFWINWLLENPPPTYQPPQYVPSTGTALPPLLNPLSRP